MERESERELAREREQESQRSQKVRERVVPEEPDRDNQT